MYNYLTKNQVEKINISKDSSAGEFNSRADITMIDGSRKFIVLGSFDYF